MCLNKLLASHERILSCPYREYRIVHFEKFKVIGYWYSWCLYNKNIFMLIYIVILYVLKT